MHSSPTTSAVRVAFLVAAFALGSPIGLAAQGSAVMPTVEQILDRYVQALGGKSALEKVTSRSVKGICENPEWETKGPFEMHTKAPNKSLSITNFADYGIIQKGFNGKTGWVQDPDHGLKEIGGTSLAQLRREADFYHDLRFRELYPTMKLLGKQEIGDGEAYVIEATPGEGLADKLYFDTKTGLLVRSDSQSEVDGARMTTVTLYDDYRGVDGIKVPYTIHQTNLEYGVTIKLEEVKHNLSIDDSKFDKPVK